MKSPLLSSVPSSAWLGGVPQTYGPLSTPASATEASAHVGDWVGQATCGSSIIAHAEPLRVVFRKHALESIGTVRVRNAQDGVGERLARLAFCPRSRNLHAHSQPSWTFAGSSGVDMLHATHAAVAVRRLIALPQCLLGAKRAIHEAAAIAIHSQTARFSDRRVALRSGRARNEIVRRREETAIHGCVERL